MISERMLNKNKIPRIRLIRSWIGLIKRGKKKEIKGQNLINKYMRLRKGKMKSVNRQKLSQSFKVGLNYFK